MSEIDLGIEGLADIETIGRGGSAAVYRARQIALDRVVAVKVLMSAWDVDVRRRFDRECRSMGKLSDDLGVVPIYESGETSTGAPYIVMPYYPAGSLQDEMNRNGPFRWPEAAKHIKAVAETIAAANESGVVHRDIKPANLLLGNDGKPRVSDFGIARHIADEQLANHSSTPLFTPAYSAPESFSENSTKPTIDVYGLGSTFWALLSGHAPFKSKGEKVDMITVFSRVANESVGDLREIAPDSVCSLIERAMAKTPADRPQNAREFLAELRVAMIEAEREPVSAASISTLTSSNLVESTIALSHPADGDQPAGVIDLRPPLKQGSAPHTHRMPRTNSKPQTSSAVMRPRNVVASPQRTGFASLFDRAFWHKNSSKFLIAGVGLLVLLTLLAAIARPESNDESAVAGARETQRIEADTSAPRIIGLSTSGVTEDSVTIEFSTDVCSIASFTGAGLETSNSPGWPDETEDCSTQHRHTFSELELGETYTVVIEVASEGSEVSSESIEFTAGFDALEGPPEVVSITRSTATIEFTTSTCTVAEFQGDGIESFAEPGWPDANAGCSEEHRQRFSGLDPGTSYTVNVEIVDKEGRSTRVPVDFVTADSSFEISQFTVSSVNESQATVSFVTSECSHARFFGSAGSYFEEGWSDSDASECSIRHTYTYNALVPDTEYSVEVEARSAGQSEKTAKSASALFFTTDAPAAVPQAAAEVVSTTTTSARLAVSTDICSIVRVGVDGRVVDSGDWESPSAATCETSHVVVIDELESGVATTATVNTKSVEGVEGLPISLQLEPPVAPSVSAVSVAVEDQTAVVTFTVADCDTYTAEVTPASGSELGSGPCPGDGSSSEVFDDLATGTYTVTVTARRDGLNVAEVATFEITSIDG